MLIAAAAATAAAGCADPGCIRNTECPTPRHRCVDAVCVLVDQGKGGEGAGRDDDAGIE
jgi:hypothetical protein